jgi:uncharacterized protein YdhG (YjbR/CyaY superfamily)
MIHAGRLSRKEAGMAAPTSVEDYLAALPEESRVALERLRMMIKAAAPEATETISYQMPAFRDRDRPLVAYAAFKNHCSFFPMSAKLIEDHKAELKPYETAKGTIRFRVDETLPATLVKKLVRARIKENEARRHR